MITDNKFFRKKADVDPTSVAANAVKDGGKIIINGAKEIPSIWSGFFSSIMGVSALGAAATALAIANLTSPKAVADNADKILKNEAMKASLAKSVRDRDKLIQRKKLEQLSMGAPLPHDRFI